MVCEELQQRVKKSYVEAGREIVTRPGELSRMSVRAIFHVSAQHGEPRNDYMTIRSYTSVISNALETMDLLNDSLLRRLLLLRHPRRLSSTIFPLLGTRSREIDAIDVTIDLVREARKYVTLWPMTAIRAIYFLAYTQRDLELCEAAFQRLGMRQDDLHVGFGQFILCDDATGNKA